MTTQCKDCVNFQRTGDNIGECRKDAPSPYAAQVGDPLFPPIMIGWSWPAVGEIEWCGEFKAGASDRAPGSGWGGP